MYVCLQRRVARRQRPRRGEIAGRRAAALIEGGALDDLLVDVPDPALAPEAIHRAKVLRAVKGQGGAFVELAGGRQGFLRGGGSAAPGRWLTVQVTGHAAVVTSTALTGQSYSLARANAFRHLYLYAALTVLQIAVTVVFG